MYVSPRVVPCPARACSATNTPVSTHSDRAAFPSIQTLMFIDELVIAANHARTTANPTSTFEIAPDWQPTPDNINALPEPLRGFIMLLQTRTDPAGDTQEIWSLRDQVAALMRRVRELEAELDQSSALSSP